MVTCFPKNQREEKGGEASGEEDQTRGDPVAGAIQSARQVADSVWAIHSEASQPEDYNEDSEDDDYCRGTPLHQNDKTDATQYKVSKDAYPMGSYVALFDVLVEFVACSVVLVEIAAILGDLMPHVASALCCCPEHSSLCYLSCYSFGCWSFTGGLIGMSKHVAAIVLLGVFLVATIVFLVATRSEHVVAIVLDVGAWIWMLLLESKNTIIFVLRFLLMLCLVSLGYGLVRWSRATSCVWELCICVQVCI
ncbi:hypothetical protein U1Q18_033002 [Sarracenia purpurea var. burkii]